MILAAAFFALCVMVSGWRYQNRHAYSFSFVAQGGPQWKHAVLGHRPYWNVAQR